MDIFSEAHKRIICSGITHNKVTFPEAKIEGMTSGKFKDGFSGKQELRKSLWLYDAANSVRMQENLSLNVIQSMAIVNNMGHIHSVLKNSGKAKLCFKHLLRLIMIVNDADGEESIEELDGFLMNVTSLILAAQTCAVAA